MRHGEHGEEQSGSVASVARVAHSVVSTTRATAPSRSGARGLYAPPTRSPAQTSARPPRSSRQTESASNTGSTAAPSAPADRAARSGGDRAAADPIRGCCRAEYRSVSCATGFDSEYGAGTRPARCRSSRPQATWFAPTPQRSVERRRGRPCDRVDSVTS